MPWIESHTVLIRHRKLISLAKDLRLKPVYILGHLHALWHAVMEQQGDGDLTDWSDEMIAEYACYSGNASKFVSLLQKNGWLNDKQIHDWGEYRLHYDLLMLKREGSLTKTRERVRKYRERKKRVKNPLTHNVTIKKALRNGRVTECNAHTKPTKPTKPNNQTIKTKPNPPNGEKLAENQLTRSVKKIVASLEPHIQKDSHILADTLYKQGFDYMRCWAAIIQARKAKNPGGYLVKILSDPDFPVSDVAVAQAKAEVKKQAWS